MKHFSAKLRLAFRTIFSALLILALTATPVSAISEAMLDFFAENGIYYYNPDGIDMNCSTKTTGNNVTIIGDSITVGSEAAIKKVIPNATIYAKSSKTFGNASDPAASPEDSGNPSGISILKYLMNQRAIGRILVFALGTNNPTPALTASQVAEVRNLTGNDTQIFFITNYNQNQPNLYDTNNNVFKTEAQNANVSIIDWATEAAKDSKYISTSDGMYVHPTAAGAELFANLIGNAVGSSTSITGGVNGNYTNYAGDAILTTAQIQQLEKNIPIYEKAIQNVSGASAAGITWQIVATIHFKEYGLQVSNPSNGQGLYQMYVYSEDYNKKHGTYPFLPAGSVDDAEFLRQTELMISEVLLKNISSNSINLNSDEGIKKLFFSYNGMASQYIEKAKKLGYTDEEARSGEGSPYVMNKYDAARDPSSPNMNPNWKGGYASDGVYDPDYVHLAFGAYTLYSAMGLATVCTNLVSGGLTEAQARKLIIDYRDNVKCTDYMSAKYCEDYGKANCVGFSRYFISRFTNAGDLPLGNGHNVVSQLTGTTTYGLSGNGIDYHNKGFVYGSFTPRPYAIFSQKLTGKYADYGHTGVVLGINEMENKIYIGQEAWGSDLDYGLRYLVNDLSDFTNGSYWYAYTDGIINYSTINSVVGGS